MFGAIPAGSRREFFCLDEHTWVWYEEWTDASGERKHITTRYEIRQNGVLKVQDGMQYQYVTGEEEQRFKQAVRRYFDVVNQQLYGGALAQQA